VWCQLQSLKQFAKAPVYFRELVASHIHCSKQSISIFIYSSRATYFCGGRIRLSVLQKNCGTRCRRFPPEHVRTQNYSNNAFFKYRQAYVNEMFMLRSLQKLVSACGKVLSPVYVWLNYSCFATAGRPGAHLPYFPSPSPPPMFYVPYSGLSRDRPTFLQLF
jgi:hypothetical protein